MKLPGYYSSASELLESAEAQKAVSALKRSNGKDEAKVGRQLEGLCLHADGNEAKLKLQVSMASLCCYFKQYISIYVLVNAESKK